MALAPGEPVPRNEVHGALPLERKLPLLIFALLALVLASSLIISYYTLRRTAETAAGARLSTLSRVLSSLIGPQTINRLATMRRVAEDTAVVNALRTPDRAPGANALRVMSPIFARADSLTPPELWTRDGRPIGTVQLEIPDDMRRVREQLRSGIQLADSGYIGKLHVSGGRTFFWEAVPVRDRGQVVGYLAQERRLGTNPRALEPFRALIGSEIALYLRNAEDSTWGALLGTAVAAPPRVERFRDSLQLLSLASGGTALASTAPLRDTPFLITLAEPMSVILARPQKTIRVLAVIAILLSIVGGLIAWAISRQLVRPLVELTTAAEEMARGRYTQRVGAGNGDEIGRLGGAFNRMAQQVQVASDHSAKAVDQLTKSVATQELLAEASRILALSLSDQSLLTDLARYCVPAIADYCSIHIVDDDGTIRRVEIAHYDPAQQETLRALAARYQYRVDGPGEVPSVIRSQKPMLVPRLDVASIKRTAADDDIRRLLEAVKPASFMCVPLVARGKSIGAMSFTMTDSGRIFSQSDVDLAMELARRTAVAIDNALIYRRSLALRMEAEAASAAKSDFLAKMSHEIRTPINAMMGYAELLEMGISGPVTAAQVKQLGRIRSSGEHLTSLVSEILDLAKIEAGRMSVETTNGIAADVIEAAVAMIRPQAETKGVELDGTIGGDPNVEYVGDPQRVQQILTNLLSNAVKFTPAGGSVSLHCGVGVRSDLTSEVGRRWACIAVEDTGVGIAREDLERVFLPFVQVDQGYTRAHGGTGLGLTISRGLAQMMGGEISVESTLGKGSRFTVWLPVAQFVHS